MYDIVIVSHYKDFNKLKFVIKYAQKNLEGFESIYLITNKNDIDNFNEIKSKTNKNIEILYEKDVLDIDLNKIKNKRPNWIYQILLKLFQDVTKNENYLILESDGVINKKLDFFVDDKIKFYLGRNQNHEPYFNFNKMIGFKKRYDYSFISEVMMYNKNYIKDMIEKTNCGDVNDFINKYIYMGVNDNCYPADYELYGNFLYNYHPEKIIFENFNYSLNGKGSTYTDSDIENIILRNNNSDYISFHTWT